MWGDPDTAIGGNRDRFPSTQVSLIASAAGEPLAMERVVALYWKPVYKFIRFKFHKDNEAAKDLTQGVHVGTLVERCFRGAKGRRPGHPFHGPIHHVDLAERAHHHVLRLEIAMQHPATVRMRQRFAHALHHAQTLAQRRAARYVTVGAHPRHQLHGVKRAAVGQRSRLVHRHDAGVLEPRDQPRFAGPFRIHHLESHAPVELRIAGGVHHPQPAAADLSLQLVARAGKVGKVHHFPQMMQHRIAQIHA
jgi:hypothetical protein